MQRPQELSTLLVGWRKGDPSAASRLIEITYQKLRRMAANYIHHERAGHTLQPTELVHELYLRLFAGEPLACENRAHFYALAARQLRRILVNYARDRRAAKRGGGAVRVDLSDAKGMMEARSVDLLAVDEALTHLARLQPRAAQVVELRFFAGLAEKEAAEVIGISVATLKRDWDFARVWLLSEMMPKSLP